LKSKTTTFSKYKSFEEYLGLMHRKAVEILQNLNENDRKYANMFFEKYYPAEKEHYWSLKKLYSLAMFIPMFLQIGLKAKKRKLFNEIIYVDTHAGPGLAKVGPHEKDIVLGSPLLSLEWPGVVAGRVKSFSKINVGFDKYFFIERDYRTYALLKKIVNTYYTGKNVEVLHGDSNKIVPIIKKKVEKKKPLILLFIDPYGELDSQLEYTALNEILSIDAVDVVFNVMSPYISRGLMGMKKSISSFRECVDRLWGPVCKDRESLLYKMSINFGSRICECYHMEDLSKCVIGINDILAMYELLLRLRNYNFVDFVPVEYKGHILYHLMFASKSKGARTWLGNYIKYLRGKAPKDYATLRSLWLKATGRLSTLF